MTTKVDASSSAETQNVQSTNLMATPSMVSTPKVSMFGAKAGFVIPKNKLSGSLVPIFRSGVGKTGGNTVKEDANEQDQRKTKWGLDLTVDAAVRKGRALAYRTRLEQITQQLKSRALDMKDNLGSQSPSKDLNNKSTSQSSNSELINLQTTTFELLELERRVIIGEIICLNPSYKAPSDYTPLLKETKIPIPSKVHPVRNFIALLLGPSSNTQRQLEEETGAKVRVYGTKKETGKKHEITQSDINEAHDGYEELYVNVSAETYEKVDAAVALIELLLTPVSGNIAVTASVSGINDSLTMNSPDPKEMCLGYTMMPTPDVNLGSAQTLLVTAVAGQAQYQSYAARWYPNAQPQPPSRLVPSSAPRNSVPFSTPTFSGTNIPPYSGPPFGMNPRNSPVTFGPPVFMQPGQHPVPQVPSQNQPAQQHPPLYPVMPYQPSSSIPHTSQPMFSGEFASVSNIPLDPQLATGSHTSPSPNRPLSMQPLGSSGWSTSLQVVPSNQRPIPTFAASVIRPSIPVPPSAITSIPSPNIAPRPPPAMLPQPNHHVKISSKSPLANLSASPQFPSQPGASPSFSLMPTQRGPVSASAGAPFAMPMPASCPLPSNMAVPRSSPVSAPPFLTPGAPVISQTSTQIRTSFNPSIPIMGQPPVSPLSLAQAPRPAQIQVPVPLPDRPPSTPVPSVGGIHGFSLLAQARTIMNNTPIEGPRPRLTVSGDFTFQPLGLQISHRSNSPMHNNQSAKQLPIPITAPQPPSYLPSIHNLVPPVDNYGFAKPQISNPALPPSANLSANPPRIQPPSSHHFSYANSVRPLPLSTPIHRPSFSSVSQVPDLSADIAIRPLHFPQPNQNQLLPVMRANTPGISSQNLGANPPAFLNDKVPKSSGVSQIYDPFSPTSASSMARKQEDNTSEVRKKETDAEYEDLMASVGVK